MLYLANFILWKKISPHFWVIFSVIKSCCFIPPHFLASLSFYSNRSTALVFPLWRRNGKEDGRGLQTPRSGSSALRVHAELHASHSHPPTAQFSLGGADMQDVPSASCKLAHHPMLLSATTSHPICPEAKVTTWGMTSLHNHQVPNISFSIHLLLDTSMTTFIFH